MTVNFKRTTAAVMIVATSALATGAAAATVSGTFDGSFNNVREVATGGIVSADDNRLNWGTPSSNSSQPGAGSRLTVNQNSFSGDFPPGGEIKFGDFSWLNKSSFKTGGVWAADMTLNIDFGTPNDLGVLSEVLSIVVDNTTDVSSDPSTNETDGRNRDFVSQVLLPNGAFDTPLDLGNGLGLTSVFLRFEDCDPPGGASDPTACNFDAASGLWSNVEGAQSTIGIYGTVETVAPVPLPAAGWLLIAGVGGLFALRRRKTA